MKKFIGFLFLAFLLIPSLTKASSIDSQSITLSPGWNIISTPKVLSSHHFSVLEISTNFDIYLLDSTSVSGWQTMQGAGQTEFQPLYAYFINNKTGSNQTLQLNYNFNLTAPQRLFQRTLNPGWNAIGIASPSYALSQGSPNSTDINNPSNILSSIVGAVGQVIDFTNSNINLDSPSISSVWLSKTASDANSLNDFRELKGYGVFVTNPTNNYNGSQNLQVTTGIAPVITLNGASRVNLLVGGSYTDAGATASDVIDGDITANIVTLNPVNTNIAGTYTVTYNISDSSGNRAQQVTRTVVVAYSAGIYARISPISPIAGQQVVSVTQTTPDAVLGVFSLKSTNNSTALNTLKIGITGSVVPSTMFSNFRLFVGGSNVAGGVLSGSTITFSNMTVPLTQDLWTDITVKADINASATGTVSLTLTPSNTDPYNPVISGISTIETINTLTTNTLTLTTNSISLSAASAVLGSAIVNASTTIGNNATYAFTLTNNSNNDLFVSQNAGTFVTMNVAGTSSIASVLANPSTVNGDTATEFAIPAGTARTFTVAGALRGVAATITYRATAINYGTSAATPTGLSIFSGLSALSLTASY